MIESYKIKLIAKAEELLQFIKKTATLENFFKIIGNLVIILIIWLTFKVIKKALKKIPEEKINLQQRVIMQKAVNYSFCLILIIYILSILGIKLSAIWGAAGIAGIAIGFAAQTSVSNFISGLFVLSERVMKIGDFISVGTEAGIVDSIDLLSVKIHTMDNQMVRIPNSSIINTNFKNNNYFPQRRFTFSVSVAYDTDMPLALETLSKVPALCPTVLENPEPKVWFDGFGESGINMILAVWFVPSDFLKTRNDVLIGIKQVFNEAGIVIPFNRLEVSLVGKEEHFPQEFM